MCLQLIGDGAVWCRPETVASAVDRRSEPFQLDELLDAPDPWASTVKLGGWPTS
ncbi:hypothetical protein [Amycolatopsis sp. NPDC051061]|uniref:hypothetical protein n=1 Tax=Amycolatopsis sp. NPDC051061 TaxID=3155042 RepID=UPI00343E77F6